MITQSGKKPGRGYTRTAWIEHHQAIVRREKEREEREKKKTDSKKEQKHGKTHREKHCGIEIMKSATNKPENKIAVTSRAALTNSLETWLQNKPTKENRKNMKNQIPSSVISFLTMTE